MNIEHLISWVGNGIDQTNILITFALLDTVLGIAVRLQAKKPLISNKFMAGLTRNFIPALLPALLQFMQTEIKSASLAYQYAEFFIFLCTVYFLLQSILSNLNGLGTPLPDFILKMIDNELKEKGFK